MAEQTKIITPKARLSFPWLFEAQPSMQPGGMAKFSCALLFPKTTDISALKALVVAVRDAKWPDANKRPRDLRNPFRDGDEKGMPGYEGCFYISASSKTRPGVVDEALQPIIDPGVIYAGCYVRASINAYAYDKAGNRGVAFGLQNVQKLGDGDPFGSRSAPTDDFTAVAAGRNPSTPGAPGGPKTTVVKAAAKVDEWGDMVSDDPDM